MDKPVGVPEPEADAPARPDDFFDFSRPQTRRSMLFLAAGALIGLAIAGYGLFTAKGTRARYVPPEAIALVNNLPILRSDFMVQVQTQFSTPFAQSTTEQRRKVLEDMIAEELSVQRGLEIDLPSFDPDVRSALVAGVELELSANVLAQQPSAEQLQTYYEAHRSKYVTEGIMRVRELVARTADVSVEQASTRAAQAVAALRAGAPLDQVMKKYGLVDSGRLMDAGHVDTGDIFEFAAKAKLGDAVYAATAPLKTGEISAPIPQPDGPHVLVMLERHAPQPQSFAQVRDTVWTDLKNEAQTRVRAANLRYLRQRADILLSADGRTLEGHQP
jgi:parvulin-like peptidyl-prolyl isomerase